MVQRQCSCSYANAHRPKEEVRELASKGGKASGKASSGAESAEGDAQSKGKQGFAAMDPEKQVRRLPCLLGTTITMVCRTRYLGMLTKSFFQREIASMGGKASSGSFEPGSEKAREAGRKGGAANSSDE